MYIFGVPRLSRAQSQAQTRQRILAAAAELFTERGVNGASLEQIAERAGYTRGALYGNFGDKHELVRALLEQRTENEAAEVRRMGPDFATAAHDLRKFQHERARHLREWMALRLELILYVLRHPEAEVSLRDREERVRGLIAEGLRVNAVGADVPMLSLIIYALEDGLLVQHLLDPQRIPADVVMDAVEYLLDLVRRAQR